MEIAVKSDFSVPETCAEPCVLASRQAPVQDLLALAWEGRTVIADWEDQQAEPKLTELAQTLGPKLLVPEIWKQVLPQAGILISSALSGGTLRERFKEAALEMPGRCWLKLEPVRMRFSLPCPTGCGTALSQEVLDKKLAGKRTFFSEDLCCRYAYDLEHGAAMILYDTRTTLAEKAGMAKETGFCGTIVFNTDPSFSR